MLAAFVSALKTPDLRKKILFTLAMVAMYRLGATFPSPGVSYGAISQCIDEAGTGNDLFTVLNLFSGGALLQLSMFALGIMPYITASIIIQLLGVVIPRFEQLKKQGQAGQAKTDPVHPIPDHRAGHPAVHRVRRAGHQRSACSPAAPTRRPVIPDQVPSR